MPDFSKPPWSALVDVLRDDVVPIVLVLIVAFVMLRASRLFVHGVIKALMDREATEGTAQELSAVELKKRMDTLDELGAHVIRFFIIVIAGLMILRSFGLDIGPAVAGLGRRRRRGRVRGAAPRARLPQRRADPDREPVQQGRRDPRSPASPGTVEDFSLRRTTLRDLDGVVHTVPNGEILVASNLTRVWSRINQDVVVAYGTDIDRATEVVDEVGRKMAADPTWKRRILEAPRVDRVAALGEYGVTLKILGTVRAPDQWSAAGELRKRLLAAFKEHGIEIPRPQRVILSRDPSGFPVAGDETAADPGDANGDLGGA